MGLLSSRIDWPHWRTRIRSWSAKSAYVMGGQILGMVFGFAATFLLSHWVAKTDYARYSLFISLAGLGIISHGGLINFATRFWSIEKENRGALWKFVAGIFWRQTPLLLGLVLATTLCATTSLDLRNWGLPFVLGAISTTASIWLTLNTAALNAGEQYRRLFLLNAASSLLRFAGPIGLVILCHGGFLALAGGFALYAVGSCAISILWFKPVDTGLRLPDNPQWPSQLISYGRPFVWIGVSGWLLQFADRWIVSLFFDSTRLADFSYASQLVGFLPAILAAWLTQVAYPGVFRHVDTHGAKTDWGGLFRKMDRLLILFFAITIIGTLFLGQLVSLLMGNVIAETYRNSLPIMLPAAMAATSLQANQFHYLLLQANLDSRAKMHIIVWASVIKTIATAAAAAVSWKALTIMWIVSPIGVAVFNRYLVKRAITAKPSVRMEA